MLADGLVRRVLLVTKKWPESVQRCRRVAEPLLSMSSAASLPTEMDRVFTSLFPFARL